MRVLIAGLFLLSLVLVPSPAAADNYGCDAWTRQGWGVGTCSFPCNVGDYLEIYVTHADTTTTATGTLQCGTQVVTCTAPPAAPGWSASCSAKSPAFTLQAGTATCTITPPTGYYWENHAYCWTSSSLPPVDPVAVENPGSSTPGVGGGSATVPAVSTPAVGSVSNPAVGVPATCSVNACSSPTAIPAVGTPGVGRTCLPANVLCVGPVAPIPVYPGGSVPALCSTPAGAACLPPGQTLVQEGTVKTDPAPSRTVGPYDVPVPYVAPQSLPGFGAYVNNTGFSAEPPSTQPSYVGPFPITGPPVPITACDPYCVVPVTLRNGVVTITVTLNGQEHRWDLTV